MTVFSGILVIQFFGGQILQAFNNVLNYFGLDSEGLSLVCDLKSREHILLTAMYY